MWEIHRVSPLMFHKEIAEAIGVATSTVSRWARNPEARALDENITKLRKLLEELK